MIRNEFITQPKDESGLSINNPGIKLKWVSGI